MSSCDEEARSKLGAPFGLKKENGEHWVEHTSSSLLSVRPSALNTSNICPRASMRPSLGSPDASCILGCSSGQIREGGQLAPASLYAASDTSKNGPKLCFLVFEVTWTKQQVDSHNRQHSQKHEHSSEREEGSIARQSQEYGCVLLGRSGDEVLNRRARRLAGESSRPLYVHSSTGEAQTSKPAWSTSVGSPDSRNSRST